MIPPSVCTCFAAAFLAFSASASAATRPTVAVVGIPHGVIAGESLPYTQTNSTVELSVAYGGRLPGGAKLELLVKPNSVSPFSVSRTPVRLSGGRAKLHVTLGGVGGPVEYEVSVVSGRRRLITSKPVTIYWAQPPGGIFVMSSSESAYTSRTNASESCAGAAPTGARCKGDAGPGQSGQISAEAGSTPMPPGWSVTLIFNGQQECTTTEINGQCEVSVTFPTVTATTVVPITAELTSPQGAVTSATLLVTIYA